MTMIMIGILCIIYFISIALFTGMGSKFNYIWLLLGIMSLILDVCYKKQILQSIPIAIRRITMICLALGAVLFLVVECCIISGFFAKGEEQLDYIIVLGAQMKENGPSRALRKRLDKAIDYGEENKNVMIVVSGGKGADEHISEAQGMYDYLTAHGIDNSRIMMEDKSTNTTENLKYSRQLVDVENSRIGIVTSNFHVFRAMGIAKAQGYQNVCGIAASAELFLQPAHMTREFFGIMKDFIFGNM